MTQCSQYSIVTRFGKREPFYCINLESGSVPGRNHCPCVSGGKNMGQQGGNCTERYSHFEFSIGPAALNRLGPYAQRTN
eukprot:9467617-Ditylum_brightwellii.AAC.1